MNEETLNLRIRYDSCGDEVTDEDAQPLHPTLPLWPPSLYPNAALPRSSRTELAFAPTEMLPHPRLVRREAHQRTRFARASSPMEPAAWMEPAAAWGAPMYLTPRPRKTLPPPLRHRAPPPPLPVATRPVTQADDEFADERFTEDPITKPFR